MDCHPQTVEEEALIKNNNTCKDFLIEAMKYHLLPLDQRLLIKNPRTKPRTPVSLPKVSPAQPLLSLTLSPESGPPLWFRFLLAHGCIYDPRNDLLGPLKSVSTSVVWELALLRLSRWPQWHREL